MVWRRSARYLRAVRTLAASPVALALVSALGLAGCPGGASPRPAPIGNVVGASPATGAGPALVDARSIELRDVWVGLGCTHEFTATLTPGGGGFTGVATLATGWQRDEGQEKTITIPLSVIANLARAADVARARLATLPPAEDGVAGSWTDDYPSGSMTFTTPDGVYWIGFEDQKRKLQLRHGEDVIVLDRDQDIFDGEASPIWKAYMGVLEAAGLPAWIDAMCDRR